MLLTGKIWISCSRTGGEVTPVGADDSVGAKFPPQQFIKNVDEILVPLLQFPFVFRSQPHVYAVDKNKRHLS
jgi:hypothetical protein